MASTGIVFVVLLVTLVQTGFSQRLCDKKIIKAIQKSWEKNPVKSFICTSKGTGAEHMVAATEGYFPGNTKCAHVQVTPECNKDCCIMHLTVSYTNGTVDKTKQGLFEISHGFLRTSLGTEVWSFYNKNGMVAWYECNWTAEKGKPEGGIKANYPFSKKDLKEAIAAAKKFGIDMSDLYSTCNK